MNLNFFFDNFIFLQILFLETQFPLEDSNELVDRKTQ